MGIRGFIWDIFPKYTFPLLTSLSIFCLTNLRSTDFMQVFGGSNGNEGLGLLSICFDWQDIAGTVNPLTILLRAQVWHSLWVSQQANAGSLGFHVYRLYFMHVRCLGNLYHCPWLIFWVSVTLLLFNSTQKYMGIQVLPIHRCHDSDVGMDYFSFLLYFPSHLWFPLRLIPLCRLWTSFCLLIYDDSCCTVLTHPRTPVLGPEGCMMTHGLIPWLTLFTLVCYRLRVLNYKYLVVAVVGP